MNDLQPTAGGNAAPSPIVKTAGGFARLAGVFTGAVVAVANNFPQLMALAAPAFYVYGRWIALTPWSDKNLAICLAITTGGLFGWLTKTRAFADVVQKELTTALDARVGPLVHDQLLKVLKENVGPVVQKVLESAPHRKLLRDEMTDAFFASDSLQGRSDLPEIWKRVSGAAGLPDGLKGFAHHLFSNHVWSNNKPFYYDRLVRRHTLTWNDPTRPANGELNVRTHITGALVSVNGTEPFDFSMRVIGDDHVAYKKTPILHQFVITPIDPPGKPLTLSKFEFIAREGDKSEEYVALVKLPAGRRYDVEVAWTYGQHLDIDSAITFEASTFITSLTVMVNYQLNNQMGAMFRELGPNPISPDPKQQSDEWQIVRGSDALICPYQGYILAVQRIPAKPTG